jgi:outer membrane biosynthesis protein TonB
MSGETSFSDFSEITAKDGAVAVMTKGNIVVEKASLDQKGNADYNKYVLEKIKGIALFDRPKTEKGEIRLAFTLSKSGILLQEPTVLQTSNYSLVPFALRAVKSAAPFSPFPKATATDKQTFNISLYYE